MVGIPQPVLRLLRFAALVYLAGSVIFTLHYVFVRYGDPQSNQAAKQRSLVEPGQATFDVESMVYSNQVMNWKSKAMDRYLFRRFIVLKL
jgi:glycosyltransferase-like protein LARGE